MSKILDMIAVNRIERKSKRQLTENEIKELRMGLPVFVQSSKSTLCRQIEPEFIQFPYGLLEPWQYKVNSSSISDIECPLMENLYITYIIRTNKDGTWYVVEKNKTNKGTVESLISKEQFLELGFSSHMTLIKAQKRASRLCELNRLAYERNQMQNQTITKASKRTSMGFDRAAAIDVMVSHQFTGVLDSVIAMELNARGIDVDAAEQFYQDLEVARELAIEEFKVGA